MNILILSAGTRNKVVKAFKRELGGDGIIAASDASGYAPALYDADKAFIVPRIDDPGYVDIILDICQKEKIGGVFSLIDPELSLIAKNKDRFTKIGVVPVVSSYELCEMSLDKYSMYEYLTDHGYKTAKCWTSKNDFMAEVKAGTAAFPVFVKPQSGSASININSVSDEIMLDALYHLAEQNGDKLMIQEYMTGQEYGCDVYIDMLSGKCVSIFLKKKLKMRAGETDKSVSVRNEKLFEMIKHFVEEAGYLGMIDIDLFNDEKTGDWYISEVNPRFGGGYPHAYACGVNFPSMVINNLSGEENVSTIGNYEEGIAMMKYNEIAIRKESELAK